MSGSEPVPPEFEERPVPLWQKIGACLYAVALVVLLLVFSGRLPADFWPPDESRIAPNILATVIQVLAWAPVAVLLWPPFRRRLHRWVTSHTAPLHAHFERLHEQRERHHAEQMAKHDEILARLKARDG